MARHPLHSWTLTGGDDDSASLLIEIHPHARPERSTTINVQPGAEVYFVTFSSHEDGADFAYGDTDQTDLIEELLQQAVERTQGPTRLTQTVLDGVIVKSEVAINPDGPDRRATSWTSLSFKYLRARMCGNAPTPVVVDFPALDDAASS